MASFCERIFLEYVYGYEEYINAVKDNHLEVLHHAHIDDEGFRAIHGVPHAFTYGSHSYNKGADVAHTLRSYMGDSAFFGGLTDFLLAYKYDDASAYDMRDFSQPIQELMLMNSLMIGYSIEDFRLSK